MNEIDPLKFLKVGRAFNNNLQIKVTKTQILIEQLRFFARAFSWSQYLN